MARMLPDLGMDSATSTKTRQANPVPCQERTRNPNPSPIQARPVTTNQPRKPVRVLIVADRPGWCFSRRAAAIKRWAPPHQSIDIVHYGHSGISGIPYPIYDCVLCLPPNKTQKIRHLFHSLGVKVPLLSGWNSGPGRNGYDVFDVVPFADYIIVNNWQSWVMAVEKSGRLFRGAHISNGVDTSFYKPTVPIEQRPLKVLWLAAKGKADDEFDVKGWRMIAQPLEAIFKNMGIDTDFRAVDFDNEMGETELRDWYNSGSVFVVTSSSEGTPNVGLEAASCGCVLVSTRVGNMVEIIRDRENGVLVENIMVPPTPLFIEAVRFAIEHRERLSREMRQTMICGNWDWQQRAPWYSAIFDAAAAGELDMVPAFSYLTTDWRSL